MNSFVEKALDRLVYHAIYHGDDAENWSPCQDGQTIGYELDKYKWHPIETAPHGVWILIYAHGVVMQACWNANGWWETFNGNRIYDGATRWMSMPKFEEK